MFFNWHILRALEVDGDDRDEVFSKYTERIDRGGDVGKYKCTECGKLSGTRAHSISHIESVHFAGTYICDKCDIVVDTKKKFYHHVNKKHKKGART